MKVPKAAKSAARKDQRIVEIRAYPDGWVANNYKYAILGKRHTWVKKYKRWVYQGYETIDRKKPYGRGPVWVGLSANGGRLASEST